MAMQQWMDRICKRLFPHRRELDKQALETLREQHRSRCLDFKLLVGANNHALEIMANLEETLQGVKPYGMHYIRSQCARVLSNVRQIIIRLQALSDEAYPELLPQFLAIQKRIKNEIAPRRSEASGPILLPLVGAGLDKVDMVGSKVACLAEAARAIAVRIPEGFVLTSEACNRFLHSHELQEDIDRRIQSADPASPADLFSCSSAIQQAIMRAPLPPAVEDELLQAYDDLDAAFPEELRLAVRSSALGEDSLDASFAGQYLSELNVLRDELVHTYKQVVASKYGVTAMSYRLSRGIPDEDVSMCVACMRMIDAVAGGVVYTRNPLQNAQDHLMCTAVLGLPKAVVDGKGQSDLFLIKRAPLRIEQRTVAVKTHKYVCDPLEGVKLVGTLDDDAPAPALSDAELLELARICLEIERHFGQPQDVEFALDPLRRIYILQCRPLQLYSPPEKNQDPDPEFPRIVLGGVTASKGVAAGEVFLLKKDIDVVRCPDGAVAVASQALPRWAPLLHRVAAIVTEQGSFAGHLANVAREFSIPALFGLEKCVELLQNYKEVTVDADNCSIYEGRVVSLLQRSQSAQRLMRDTPVYHVLQRALEHIAPLHLLDPESSDFRPDNCRTLHDITRFCHEMSVRHMFAPDAQHPDLQRLSKQLFHKVAMQYWIIDLGGGIEGEDRGRFVLLEDIKSRPMLALWKGMTAVAADTPPPVDAKGFMAVLLEATTNPELEASMQSGFTMRNYFMISRDFCSLQARFGFHFCTVECQAGDDPADNYASFHFKGGAADMDRKILRAELVRELLEEFGFRTERKHDALFARVEDRDAETMDASLMVLGYIIIHTRQLDMVMANPSLVESRKKAMLHDLHTMLARNAQAGE